MFNIFFWFFIFLHFIIAKRKDNFPQHTIQNSSVFSKISKSKNFKFSNHVIAPKYNLTSCYIGKSLSSMTLGLFCYLYDEKKFLENYKKVNNGGANRKICGDKNKYSSILDIAKKYGNGDENEILQNWTNFMIVREPISRFISGFVQLCVLNIGLKSNHPYCFNCKKSMKCFLNKMYKHIQSWNRKLNDVDKFIVYHFYPQSWQCEYLLYKDYYTIFIYSEDSKSFNKEYLSKLKDSSIPDKKILFIEKIINNPKLRHSTSNRRITKNYKKKLLKDKYLINLVKKIFSDDYKEFDFKTK